MKKEDKRAVSHLLIIILVILAAVAAIILASNIDKASEDFRKAFFPDKDKELIGTYTLTTEQLSAGYTGELAKGDRVKFIIENQTHQIEIVSLKTQIAKINIASELQEATLSIGDLRKFELTGDNYYDFSIALKNINPFDKTGIKAGFTVNSIQEEITEETKLEESEKEMAAVEEERFAPEYEMVTGGNIIEIDREITCYGEKGEMVSLKSLGVFGSPNYGSANYCEETDKGIDYYNKGITTGQHANGSSYVKVDYCLLERFYTDRVREYYCLQNVLMFKDYQCPYECEDGECKYCQDTCNSLGYECGFWNVCGWIVNCGSCGYGEQCVQGVCEIIPECTRDSDCSSLTGICSNGVCIQGKCQISLNSSTDVCRPASGECDQAEYCNQGSCPKDIKKQDGELCSGGSCSSGICVQCQPDCQGKNCGGDGCGGSCGSCGYGEQCVQGVCEIIPECTRDSDCSSLTGICSNGVCIQGKCQISLNSSTDVCRPASGECDQAEYCNQGSCPKDIKKQDGELCSGGSCSSGICVQCQPDCQGKNCGGDGCGGSCGSCSYSYECVNGKCGLSSSPDYLPPQSNVSNITIPSTNVSNVSIGSSPAYCIPKDFTYCDVNLKINVNTLNSNIELAVITESVSDDLEITGDSADKSRGNTMYWFFSSVFGSSIEDSTLSYQVHKKNQDSELGFSGGWEAYFNEIIYADITYGEEIKNIGQCEDLVTS